MSTIGKIWKNRTQILEGIKNSIFKSEDVEKIAAQRRAICEQCPLIDHEGFNCELPGTHPCCGECGCSLHLKTRSLSSECPHPEGSRWKALLTMDEEDELYGKIGYDPEE